VEISLSLVRCLVGVLIITAVLTGLFIRREQKVDMLAGVESKIQKPCGLKIFLHITLALTFGFFLVLVFPPVSLLRAL
jgi:hypothetical protein